LGDIQGFTQARFIEDEEVPTLEATIEEFRNLIDAHLPQLHTLTKTHLLLAHVPQFVRRHRYLGLLSEQSIESLHSTVNADYEKYKSLEEGKKLAKISEKQLIRNFLSDTGRSK